MAPSNQMSFRDQVAQKMIDLMEKGQAPWQKPWKPGMVDGLPFNPTTNASYRGINDLWLTSQVRQDPRWMTFNQAKAAGASVRKGEKATTIEYWQWTKQIPAKDDNGNQLFGDNGKKLYSTVRLQRPNVFYAKVFNAEQIEGLEPYVAPEPKFDPIERAEQIMSGANVPIFHDQVDQAFYKMSIDEVHLPPQAAFKGAAEYYGTALHELGHSTRHPSRLDRPNGPFGTEMYAREELRAEISSYMVARELGLPFQPDNNAAYLKSWCSKLKEDKHEIFRASADAEKIKTWLLEPEKRQELERVAQQRRVANQEQNVFNEQSQEQTMTTQGISYDEAFQQIKSSNLEALPNGLWTLYTELQDQHAIQGERSLVISDERDLNTSLLATTIMDWNISVTELQKLVVKSEISAGWFNHVSDRLGLGDRTELQCIANVLEYVSNPVNADQLQRATMDSATILYEDMAEYAKQSSKHAELLSAVTDAYKAGRAFTGYINPEDRQNEMIVAVSQNNKPQENIHEILGLKLTQQEQTLSETQTPISKPNRIYIAVPYAERFDAKKLGARWDKTKRSWFITQNQDRALFIKWDNQQSVSQDASLTPEQEFTDVLRKAGYTVKVALNPDGQWHRLPMTEDKPGKASGGYRMFVDGVPNIQYRDFKSAVLHKHYYTGVALTPEQQAQIKADAAQVKANREQARKAEQNQAAKRAYGIYVNAKTPASQENSEYLKVKGVQGYGARITDHNDMIIPVYRPNGRVVNIQTVNLAGKFFLKNGELIGCLHAITGPKGTGKLSEITSKMGGAIIICEGKATGDSLHEATGRPVVVAWNADNLAPVAKILREKFPERELLIVADNDHKTKINGKFLNIGVNKATAAAKETGAIFVVPEFTEKEKAQGLTDANDLSVSRGKQAVRSMVNRALVKSNTQSLQNNAEMSLA